MFTFIPVIRGFIISFTKWNVFTSSGTFVGLDNYAGLLHDDLFWTGLRNSSYFAFLTAVGNVVIAFLAALAIKQKLVGLTVYRVVFYAPVIISVSAMGAIWKWLLSTQFGVINYFLVLLGLPKVEWIASPNLVIPSLSLVSVWWGFGFPMLIFLAALQEIPDTVYEAAMIDGASVLQRLFRITIPLLRPTFLLISVTQIASHLQVFGQSYIISEGGPGYSSYTLVMHLYQTAWRYLRMGEGSAIAFVLALLIVLLTAIQFRLLGSRVDY